MMARRPKHDGGKMKINSLDPEKKSMLRTCTQHPTSMRECMIHNDKRLVQVVVEDTMHYVQYLLRLMRPRESHQVQERGGCQFKEAKI